MTYRRSERSQDILRGLFLSAQLHIFNNSLFTETELIRLFLLPCYKSIGQSAIISSI